MNKGPYYVDSRQASSVLLQGGVVALPTETVYGLAGLITFEKAIQKIFEIKKRPFFDPLIIHIGSIDQAKGLVQEWPLFIDQMAEHFWPGPITFVLPKSDQVSDLITSGLKNVGIRIPNHPLALEVLKSTGVPFAAPSANLFGKLSPTASSHVVQEFYNTPLPILDGGECGVGIESTVIGFEKKEDNWYWSILRPGFFSKEEVESFISKQSLPLVYQESIDKKSSPGQMKHHYMPRIPLVLAKRRISPLEIINKFYSEIQNIPDKIDEVSINKPRIKPSRYLELKLPCESVLAARSLYSQLRILSESDQSFNMIGPEGNCLVPGSPEVLIYYWGQELSQDPLWGAIHERLSKAASFIME